ncbi:Na(+)/citrate cotransporter-like [Pristis pectinata]|uniref:Na(+)/citrate cotransporter-like n=1 Tax=Pristis pectinata TaxID=685728 RepID=UPI00223E3A60|nr:Na(+)/citrate cotransporter-like [Pristis pectinata]
MLSCLRPLRRYRDPLALALPVLLLLPLPLALRNQEAYCGFVVLLMAIYWCTEVIPLAITAILPVILFPVFGIMTSKEVCKRYMKDTNMLFLGGLMVAVAIETWNLHKRIALRALLIAGVRPALLMMGFMGVTAFLSMWISNTATTAMMVPIAQAVLDQLNAVGMRPASGQATNDVELEEKSAGCEVYGAALSSLDPDSNLERNLPAASTSEDDREQVRLRKMLSLSVCYAASIGGTATLTGTGPNLVLKGQLGQLFPENGDLINFASWFGFAFPNMLVMLTFCWIWLHLLFLGVNFGKSWRSSPEYSPKEKAAYRVIQSEYQRLGPMSFAEKLVLSLFILLVLLWFTREPGFVPGWGNLLFNGNGKEFVTDATVVISITFLMFIMPSQRPQLRPWAQDLQGAEEGIAARQLKEQPSARLLEWTLVQQKVPWNVVLLLGGGFALARGCEESGLSRWLGNQLLPLQNIPPWSIAAVLCLLIAICTECTSNVATATLFLPILASMASLIRMNPLYVMIPGTLSTSFAFMLPVATPPNAIVFSYGQLRVSDMVKAGIALNLIGVASVTLAINTWGRAMFSLDTFPAWANTSHSL